MTYMNALVQGILLGGLYALLATGLSLTFGVMRLVNLAHGDLAVLGAFFCASVSDGLGWSPLVSLAIVLPAAFALGFVLDKAIFDRILAMDYGRKLIEGDPHAVMGSREVRDVYLGTDPEAA